MRLVAGLIVTQAHKQSAGLGEPSTARRSPPPIKLGVPIDTWPDGLIIIRSLELSSGSVAVMPVWNAIEFDDCNRKLAEFCAHPMLS